MKIIGRYPTDSTAAKRLDQVGPLPPGEPEMQVNHVPGSRGPVTPARGWEVADDNGKGGRNIGPHHV